MPLTRFEPAIPEIERLQTLDGTATGIGGYCIIIAKSLASWHCSCRTATKANLR
jgi:hypothetical protein